MASGDAAWMLRDEPAAAGDAIMVIYYPAKCTTTSQLVPPTGSGSSDAYRTNAPRPSVSQKALRHSLQRLWTLLHIPFYTLQL